jgi:hypothetical protein
MTEMESVDLNFVTDDVMGGEVLQWATSFTNLKDMVDKAIAEVTGPPRRCIGRLVIAAHGAEDTNGFTVFDANTSGTEFIDGGNGREPLGPGVAEQFARLKEYFCPEAVIEFRICRMGIGDAGERAMKLIANIAGVPVTAPEDEISSLAAIGGLSTDWRTVYPDDWNKASESSFWRGEPEAKPEPEPASTGLGGILLGGVLAGVLLLGGAGYLLFGGNDEVVPPPAGGPVQATGTAAAAAPIADVRVSPVEAVFNQATFTTTYSVLITIEPPDGNPGLTIAWSGADCGSWEVDRLDARIYRWVHPHPPCDATTDHSTRTITLEARWAGGNRQLRCTYQGAASGVGPPCVDARTGAPSTPVGGGR